MDFKDRVAFYLGEDKDIPHPQMNEYCISDLNNRSKDKIYSAVLRRHLTRCREGFQPVYDVPLMRMLRKYGHDKKRFSFTRGDVITKDQQHNWSLSKNRCDGNKSSVIVRSFNFKRHWGMYYRKPRDMDFNKKLNKVFWRGTTTGASSHFAAKSWNPRPVNRFKLVKTWFKKNPRIDVGFSFIHRDWLKPEYGKYVKGKCSPREFLKHKYIISVEGNDKDSGINWKLNSNSVVLMARPRVVSWLMESELIPGKHYILLKDDFSDLHEKLLWCDENQEACKQIIRNANEFMRQFSNTAREEQIEKAVLESYFNMKRALSD